MFSGLLRRAPTRLHAFNLRYYSNPSPSAQHSIYISNSTNPYFNLTFEDWLFRHKAPEEPLLLIYRDDPCIIIGRNQNPWKEINFEALHAKPGVPFIRRRSGGGTVYHDHGNTNFSIHLPRHAFDRHTTARVILRAVQSLGVDARINERNDLCVGQDKISDFVGSAYKIVNTRAYHHGTMLISSRLDTLGDLLRTNKDTMITRGVASVRSPVCNLQQFNHEVTHVTFTNAVVKEFQREYGIDCSPHYVKESDDLKNVEYIRKGLEELSSWDWAYGQTPEFTYKVSQSFEWGQLTAEIQSKHGIILSCTFDLPDTQLDDSKVRELTVLSRFLEGKQYGFQGNNSQIQEMSGLQRDTLVWIQEIMKR